MPTECAAGLWQDVETAEEGDLPVLVLTDNGKVYVAELYLPEQWCLNYSFYNYEHNELKLVPDPVIAWARINKPAIKLA